MILSDILPSPYFIEFIPCTGFGTSGRQATIYFNAEYDCPVFRGIGETDEESVLEALISGGIEFDRAFDLYSDVLRNSSRIIRHSI